jgi:type II secretory ATPase GspE/PulE/Tfp pilus assembly ATPase PilB-like protein
VTRPSSMRAPPAESVPPSAADAKPELALSRPPPRKRLRLGEILLEAKLVSPDQVEVALAEVRKQPGQRIGEVLVRLGFVSEPALTQALGTKFAMPVVDLDRMQINPMAWRDAPFDLMQRYLFLPLTSDARSVRIAIADPLNADLTDVLRFHLAGRQLQEVLATPSQLRAHVQRYSQSRQNLASSERIDAILKQLSVEAVTADDDVEDVSLTDTDSAVIKLVNQMILDAWERGASDIHVEPRGSGHALVVRFRIDGECVPYQRIPSAYRAPLVSRLKIIAGLDISERRKPQDGKIRFGYGEKSLELRVVTLPTAQGGEDVVMRLLANVGAAPLEKLSLSHRNMTELKRIMAQPYGLMLCVGPTGSGKTTTLHAMLGALNTPNKKIWTAEDPIEITQDGLRQVQVQPRIGFDFASAMRSFLRADPDIIMVGEMRDRETAGIAIEASLTGHLVLSTLHTNTAPETVTRLLEMDIDPFAFGDALLGVLAQRLARRLCRGCRKPRPTTPDETAWIVESLGGPDRTQALLHRPATRLELWEGTGCSECGNTGYVGRIALHELLVADDELRHAIVSRAPIATLRQLAMAGGMATLMQDGIAKAVAGETDLRQVKSVCAR